jgi:hypothetical protein
VVAPSRASAGTSKRAVRQPDCPTVPSPLGKSMPGMSVHAAVFTSPSADGPSALVLASVGGTMPNVESRIEVPVDAATAFAVSQTTGAARLRWDPFIRHQRLLDGATGPGKGVRTATAHRLGLTMESEYVSYAPPRNVGMRMTRGPWFFALFAGGWRFEQLSDDPPRTLAVWRYRFEVRPRWLRPIGHPIGTWLLQRDIDRRLAGFARGCVDPEVLAAVHR